MQYKEILKIEPCHVYMNSHDKAIVNFHKANLEYKKGCPLDKLSLEYWDADDEWDLDGPNCVIINGHGKVTKIISDAIRDITKLSHSVTNIEIIDGGVKIKGIQKETFGKPEFEETAAAVICTLPLGVLKYSIKESSAAKDNHITFTPPLPKWKTKAIKNMGFGSLNKVMLVFKKPFWKTEEHKFSRISSTAESQGECFQFFVVPKEPVLIAILSGRAANNVDDINLKKRTMDFLRSTFPYCPKEPLEFIVTRWHNDTFSRGCFSYVGVDAQDRDHEVLGEPICDAEGIPRIFFGGEHTISRWPSTVHGAMISGMREATRVADTFYGTLPIFAPEIKHASINDTKYDEDKNVVQFYAWNLYRIGWALMGFKTYWFMFCTSVEECKDNGLTDFYGLKPLTYIRFNSLRAGLSRASTEFVFRYNVAIMEPRIKVDYIYQIDVSTFNFPAAWYYFNDERYLKVILQLGKIEPYNIWRNGTSLVFFRDEQDRCESYRPKGKALKHENILNLNFFVNRKYSKYSYFFIKKDNFICSYVFKPEDLDVMFNETENGAPNNRDLPEIEPINFVLINNFPTQNYAQNFFCLDPLYGTFVSFFWNHEPSSPPEAHYYSIDESNLKNFEMIDKIILKDFDMNVLKDIFENRFDKRYLPIFESYGKQIFIRFVYPKEDPEDNDNRTIFWGLWKNENEKDVKTFKAKVIWSPSQRLNAYDMNVVFRAKKSWIQKVRPFIILVILIICKFRGAKKMKKAMAKKKVEKSGKKKPQSSETKEVMPKKKPPKMKKQKKLSFKKSKDTGNDAKKTATTTTFDQTNYFTVNDTFEKNTK
uniref:Amine oxidase domain-containing protein n=1 Tax=Panagrolaimus sp. PS1159 TaxID=55785 RepID=A0AC35G1E0_9BILA